MSVRTVDTWVDRWIETAVSRRAERRPDEPIVVQNGERVSSVVAVSDAKTRPD